jgi:hypothetical protein
VTLMQRNGAAITGKLGQCDSHQSRSVVIQETDADRMWFVGLHDISAICVHEASGWGPTLSEGVIDPASLAEPVAPLAANRQLAEFTRRMQDKVGEEFAICVDWDAFDRADRNAMAGVGLFLEALQQTLEQLVEDGFGRDAVAAKVKAIVVEAGSRDLQLVDGRLTIWLDTGAGLEGRYTAEQLAQALNLLL